MALSFTKSKTNVKRNYYTVYMRETGTTIASGDYDTLAHWTTFLALFTDIGHVENKNTSLKCEPADPVELEDGEEHYLGFQGEFECKFLQSASADDSALVDMEGKDCDLLLVEPDNNLWVYLHDKRFKVAKDLTSGEIEYARIFHKQLVANRSDYYEKGAVPTS